MKSRTGDILLIHTDASCGHGKVGIGYVIRIDNQVHKGSTSFSGQYTSMEAEYLALREAAKVVANHLNTKEHMIFYTDCQGLKWKMEGPNESDKWITKRDDLNSILSHAPEWSIQWIPRERNTEADSLAATARDS